MALLVVGGLLALPVVLRLDGWQRLYASMLVVLFLAVSTLPFAGTVFYVRYGAAALVAAWLWISIKRDTRPLREAGPLAHATIRYLWIAVVFAALFAPFSANGAETFQQLIALILLVATLHGLAVTRWQRAETMWADLGVAAGVATLVAIAGVGADFTGAWETRAFNGRFQGLFANPNTLAAVCALTLPLTLGLWTATRHVRWLAAAVTLGATGLMTESRTAAVAVIFALVWALLRRGATAVAKTAYFVSLIATVWAIGYVNGVLPGVGGATSQLVERFTADEGGDLLNSRTLAWSETLDLLHGDHWLIGYGYAAGPTVFEEARLGGEIAFGRDVVHNSYLQWLLELGVVGLWPLILLATVWIRIVFKSRRDPTQVWLAAGIVVGLLVCLTESALFGTGQMFPWVFWPIVLAAALRLGAPPASEPDVPTRVSNRAGSKAT